jgi:hypothetical protein
LERDDAPSDALAWLDGDVRALLALDIGEREAAALALLQSWVAAHQRRVLMLIDSSGLLFAALGRTAVKGAKGGTGGGSDAGATPLWRLRKTLSHFPGILWLGASYQALETDHQYSDAFHDFFEIMELRPLSLRRCEASVLRGQGRFRSGLASASWWLSARRAHTGSEGNGSIPDLSTGSLAVSQCGQKEAGGEVDESQKFVTKYFCKQNGLEHADSRQRRADVGWPGNLNRLKSCRPCSFDVFQCIVEKEDRRERDVGFASDRLESGPLRFSVSKRRGYENVGKQPDGFGVRRPPERLMRRIRVGEEINGHPRLQARQ